MLRLSGGICVSTVGYTLPGIISAKVLWPKDGKFEDQSTFGLVIGAFALIALGLSISIFTVADVIFINPPRLGP